MDSLHVWLSPERLWIAFGFVGMVIFNGRFYVQWIASERKKQSVIPVAFWYLSAVGSVMQFVYAVHRVSPGASFGYCFNITIYVRNLVHIWRAKGKLTPALNYTVHGIVAIIVTAATVLMVMTWVFEYKANQGLDAAQAARNWFWLGVWGVGQILFFLRFFIQWLATEKSRKSVVPPVFWHLSLFAALLQGAAFVQRHDWIFAVGMVATLFIYARNLWFIYRNTEQSEAAV